MNTRAVCLATFLAAFPATAFAQVSVDVDVGVSADDSYDTTAPGDPVESTDVFYDQLAPYGEWVDEPDVGRVFIPDTADYVPYRNGHWSNTSLGFVWVSDEPHAWATSHYGRWAFSNDYNRWYWLPDTQWGPAWVSWRQTGSDFGWAPLAPQVVIDRGWQPPVDTWHYCGAEHVLDVNVTRYYEPRDRVEVIYRQSQPIVHYSTVSNVQVVVGPPRSVLIQHHINAQPVRVDARTIGRWSPAEAHAQVVHAQANRATFEVQNQQRIEAHPTIRAANVKVIDTHPQLKVEVNARAHGDYTTHVQGNAVVGGHGEVTHPGTPTPTTVHTPPTQPAQPIRNAPPLHGATPPTPTPGTNGTGHAMHEGGHGPVVPPAHTTTTPTAAHTEVHETAHTPPPAQHETTHTPPPAQHETTHTPPPAQHEVAHTPPPAPAVHTPPPAPPAHASPRGNEGHKEPEKK